MVRKPLTDAARSRFAQLLAAHLTNGTRPASATGEPWTYAEFAGEIPSERSGAFVSERSVSNWCKGKALPAEIEPICRALFGPESGTRHTMARAALRRAFQTVRAEKNAAVVGLETGDPTGVIFIPDGDHLAKDPTDRITEETVAGEPIQQQLQEMIRDFAASLAEKAQRLANARTWGDLAKRAAALQALAALAPADFAARLGTAYPVLARLGGFLETDALIRSGVSCVDEPLDLDIHRDLTDLVRTAAPWLRGFPTVAALDDAAGKALVRAALLEPARVFPQIAVARGLIGAADAADMALMAEAADIATFQGQKAMARTEGDAWNLMLAAAQVRARAEVAPPDDPAGRLLAQRAGAALAEGKDQVEALAVTKPDDLRHAMRSIAAAGDTALGDRAAGDAEIAEVPEDVEAHAKEMVLNGRAPPVEWRPFIRQLDFDSTPLAELSPLSSLTALESLDLRNTQVSDVAPLSNLTALKILTLNNTQVSDVAPLSSLTALKILTLNNTQVSDVAPLSSLTALKILTLNNTQVSDVAPLSSLAALQTLDLRNTQVSDVVPLSSLTALKSLYLSDTQVSGVAALSSLTALKILTLNNTQVSDVAALSSLTALKILTLNNTQVSDVAPLSSLTALKFLDLRLTLVRLRDIDPAFAKRCRIRFVGPTAPKSS